MISRRNIRVKVMQTLYTVTTLENTAGGESQRILQQHFNQTRSLLIYLTWFLIELARYAQKDAHHRASKHLPSEADLHVNTKIAGNEVLRKMLEDPALKEQFSKEKPEHILHGSRDNDQDLIRKIYQQLVATPEYKTYISHAT